MTEQNNVEALSLMARYYETDNKIEKAEKYYQQVISLQPAVWKSHNEYGSFLLAQGQLKSAIKLFKTVISLSLDNDIGYTNLGSSYYFLNEFDLAIEYWQQSLILNKNQDTFANLGTLYYQMGQFNNAIEMFDHSIKLSPNNHVMQGYLADAFYFSKQPRNKAKQHYLTAIKLVENDLKINPNNASTLASVARANGSKTNRIDSNIVIIPVL